MPNTEEYDHLQSGDERAETGSAGDHDDSDGDGIIDPPINARRLFQIARRVGAHIREIRGNYIPTEPRHRERHGCDTRTTGPRSSRPGAHRLPERNGSHTKVCKREHAATKKTSTPCSMTSKSGQQCIPARGTMQPAKLQRPKKS